MADQKKIETTEKELAFHNEASDLGIDVEVATAYLELIGAKYADASKCEEAYAGKFPSDEDFVQNLLEGCGDIPTLPNYVYIDWERTARDVMMDYSEQDGYYFRNI